MATSGSLAARLLLAGAVVALGIAIWVVVAAPPVGQDATVPLGDPAAGPGTTDADGPLEAAPVGDGPAYVVRGLALTVQVPVDDAGRPYPGRLYALEAGAPGVDDLDLVPEVAVYGEPQARLLVPFAGTYDIGFVPFEHAWAVLASGIERGASGPDADPSPIVLRRPPGVLPIALRLADAAWPDPALESTLFAGDDNRPGRRRLPGRGEGRTFTVKLTGWRGEPRSFCELPPGEPAQVGARLHWVDVTREGERVPYAPVLAPRFLVTGRELVVRLARPGAVRLRVADRTRPGPALGPRRVELTLRGPDDLPRARPVRTEPGGVVDVVFQDLVPGPHRLTWWGPKVATGSAEFVVREAATAQVDVEATDRVEPEALPGTPEGGARHLRARVRGLPRDQDVAFGVHGADPGRPGEIVGGDEEAFARSLPAEPGEDAPHEGDIDVRLFTADPDGPFEALAYAVPTAVGDRGLAAGPFTWTPGIVATVVLVPGGFVRVTWDGLGDDAAAPLRLVHARGVPLPVHGDDQVVFRAAVRVDARPRIGPLVPGEQALDLYAGRRFVRRIPVTVVAGETVRISVP